MKTKFTRNNEKPSFLKLVAIASASGWVGGAAGNPADIINVRMQQDRANPPEKRRNYKNAIDGLIRALSCVVKLAKYKHMEEISELYFTSLYGKPPELHLLMCSNYRYGT